MEADLSIKNYYKYNDLGCTLLAAKLLVNVLHLNVWQGNLHRRVQAKSEKHPTSCSQAEACLCNWFGSIPHHRPCWCPWTNSLQPSAKTLQALLGNQLRILWCCYCLLPNASKCYPPCHCMRHILRKANEQEMVSLVSLAVQNRPWFWVTWILKPTLCWLCVLSFSERRPSAYQESIKTASKSFCSLHLEAKNHVSLLEADFVVVLGLSEAIYLTHASHGSIKP